MYALVDCNNFFVSCERLFRPDLESKPVAVLSNNDGCFVSRSQEVKDLGLPMGAPLFKHQSIVNSHGVELFSANFELYGDISERIVDLLMEQAPLIEVYSIDESFMDLSQLSIKSYQQWAEQLKLKVWREIGIPVSVSVASTKTLAKAANHYAKRHGGVCVIETDQQRIDLLDGLQIDEVWGIGWRMAPKLKELGVSSAAQLVSASDKWLAAQFSITGLRTVDELRGVKRLQFGDKSDKRQQILVSRSFGRRINTYHQLESALSSFTAKAGVKLRRQASVCRQVGVFLSSVQDSAQPSRVSVTISLPEATMDTARLIVAALDGLNQIYDKDFTYTRAGVVLLDISDTSAWQLALVDGDNRRDSRSTLMQSIDQLNSKYGQVVWQASQKSPGDNWHSRHQRRSPRYTTVWHELPRVGL